MITNDVSAPLLPAVLKTKVVGLGTMVYSIKIPTSYRLPFKDLKVLVWPGHPMG